MGRRGEHIRPYEFSPEIRQQVRTEQQGKCGFCGKACDGQHLRLDVHHKVPISHYGKNERDNAVGLCSPKDRPQEGCHEFFNRLALQDGIYFDDVVMKPNVQYDPRDFAPKPKVPMQLPKNNPWQKVS